LPSPSLSPSQSPSPSIIPVPVPTEINPWNISVVIFDAIQNYFGASSDFSGTFGGTVVVLDATNTASTCNPCTIDTTANWDTDGVALYAAGNFNFDGSIYNKDVEIAGNLQFLNQVTSSLGKTLLVGGSASAPSGATATVEDNLLIGTSCADCLSGAITAVTGQRRIGWPFVPALNISNIQTYFTCVVSVFNAQSNTAGAGYVVTGATGSKTLTVNPVFGVNNYITIQCLNFNGVNTIVMNGNSSTGVVLLVNDTKCGNIILPSITWTYSGLPPNNAIMYIPNSLQLYIPGGTIQINLLARQVLLGLKQRPHLHWQPHCIRARRRQYWNGGTPHFQGHRDLHRPRARLLSPDNRLR